jgi:hypothetical protein
MDRDCFPELVHSETGWPKMKVPWGTGIRGDTVDVTVCEDDDCGSLPVIDIVVPGSLRIFVNGKEVRT